MTCGAAAEERKEGRGAERRGADVAEEFRVLLNSAARSRKKPCLGSAGGALSPRVSGSAIAAQTTTMALVTAVNRKIASQPKAVSSRPPISGPNVGTTTMTVATSPIIDAALLAVEQVADDGAADHDAGRGAERLQHPRHDQAAGRADAERQHARRRGEGRARQGPPAGGRNGRTAVP